VTPCGERFFSIGVNVVDGGSPPDEATVPYWWKRFEPSLDAWAAATHERLAAWGFNSLGAWSLPPRELRLPGIVDLGLGRRANGLWDDPLNPSFAAKLRAEAEEQTAPYRGSPWRIGYFLDNEIGWWNGPLFTVFSSYPADNRTKQHLVSMLRAEYRGDWQAFLRDFVPPPGVASFDDLLEAQAPTRLRAGGHGFAAVRRWTRIVAESYYRAASAAVRAADPDALIFSDRLPIYYDPDAVRAMTPYVDAIAINYNVDGPDGWIAPYFFAGLHELSGGKPTLVSEWFFAAFENSTGNLNRTGYPRTSKLYDRSNNINRTGHLMTVRTQAERATGARTAARRFAALPDLVGLHWFQYYDHPKGGRPDGEDYDFGLVDVHDRPYRRLTESFAEINRQLPAIHAEAAPAAEDPEIPWAPIAVDDRSLKDWPKDGAVEPLIPEPGEARFGDVLIAWDEHGLHLATVSMDYYDPGLLAPAEEFPREEAFRIDWGVDAGAGPRHVVIRVVPPPPTGGSDKPEFKIELCLAEGTRCTPIEGARSAYFGVALDQPRVILEATVPWRAFGVAEPPEDRRIGLELAVTSFFRARWMSLSGLPPAQAIAAPKRWRSLRLELPPRHAAR
jgi:hypothetical protein